MDFDFKKRTLLAYFGKIPYVFAYWLIRTLFSDEANGLSIWSRNSFALGYLEFGFSDLDLTLFASTSFDRNRLLKTKERIEKLKLILPFIGEINIYHADDLKNLENYINYFELARDPKALEKFDLNLLKRNMAPQAIVFVLKQLESDLQMLNRFPRKRIKKWSYIYEQINQTIPESELSFRVPFNENKIIETMLCVVLHLNKVFVPTEFQIQFQKLNFMMELIYKKTDFHTIPTDLLLDVWIYTLSFEKIPALNISPSNLSPAHIDIIKEKIHWEIFGNYTQTPSLQDSAHMTHFKNIFNQIRSLNSSYSTDSLTFSHQYIKKLLSENNHNVSSLS